MNLLLIANICEDPNVLKAIKLIKDILDLAAFALPAILVIISTVDIGKSVILADKAEMIQKFGLGLKRLVLAALIFFFHEKYGKYIIRQTRIDEYFKKNK